MSPQREITNVAASVRTRLLDLARRQGVEFQLILSRFATERFLYRLGASRHGERFVLKGATLFRLWSDEQPRATWDLDLLGRGSNTIADVVAVVSELCGIHADDGIEFDPDSITGEEIRVPDEYSGIRVRLEARLADARIPVQVDVGFGNAVVPPPKWEIFPTLLEHDPPRILAYSRDAVVAEKLETAVSLGVTNSRMKDFYDLHRLASSAEFDGPTLVEAVRATFGRRQTPLPDKEPLVLTAEFLTAPEREVQWRAFLRRGRLEAPPDARELVEDLREFLLPVLKAAASGREFPATWHPGGPWETRSLVKRAPEDSNGEN